MTGRTINTVRAVLLIALGLGAIQSAKADVCCPSGCVPLNNGTTTCVRAGTNQTCAGGSICGGSSANPAPAGGQPGTYVAPILPPSACGLFLQCTYANGVAMVSLVNSSGTGYKNPPKYWVYTRVVYAGGCVGAGAPLNIPLDGKATLNLFTLQYHNLCTNVLPMTFLARIGSIPDSVGSCDCSIRLPAPAYGPASCRQGFVWRNAFDGDTVCVTPARQTQVQGENANAGSTRAGSGAYGPNTCRSGFVWRAARPTDLVCVTPQSRDQVKSENDTAWDRVAHIAGQ
jgi:hypothetical protein